MNLTPLDIRRQQFTKAFRGYEPTEVDTFLKQVSDQLETMLDEVRHANERVRDAEAKLTHYEKVELALQEALETARETARRSEVSAEARAKLIIEEAELKAERLVHDAERERYGLRQDLAKLNSRQTEVAARLRGFLLSELEVLAQFQGDDPVGFIKLQSAQAPAGTLPPPAAQLAAGEPVRSEAAPPEAAQSDDDAPSAPSPEPPAYAPIVDADDEAFELGGEAMNWPPGSEPAFQTPAAPEPDDAAAVEPAPEPAATPVPPPQQSWPPPPPEPAAEEPSAPDEPASPADEPAEADEPPSPPAVTGGWDLRSLVTGEERSVAASEAERERIRRILDDLD